MSEPEVGSSERGGDAGVPVSGAPLPWWGWGLIGSGLALGTVLAATDLLKDSRPDWGLVLGSAGGSAVAAVAWLVLRVRTVFIDAAGLRVEGPAGDGNIPFANIARVAGSVDDHVRPPSTFFGSEVTSERRRRVRLMLHDPPGRVVTFTSDIETFRLPDPISRVFDRLVTTRTAEIGAALAAGHPLTGQGWELRRDRLISSPGTQREREVPLRDVVDVRSFYGRLRVWSCGEEEPFLDIPADDWDVPSLRMILKPIVEAVKPDDLAAKTGTGLGRVLFEHRPPTKWVMLGGAGILLVAVLVGLLGAKAARFGMEKEATSIAAGLACAGLALLALGVKFSCEVFRVHERGVSRRTMLAGDRAIPFDELASMISTVVSNYQDGTYVGTAVYLEFRSENTAVTPIRFRTGGKNLDLTLMQVPEQAARILGEKLKARLAAGESVQFTPDVKLSREGVIHSERRSFRLARDRVIPWPQIRGCRVSSGSLLLTVADAPDPIPIADNEQPQFQPLAVVLEDLLASRERSPAA